MIDISIEELKNEIESLNGFINEYEEIQLNLFHQLKEACINWQDGDSVEFDNKIALEKSESELILQSIKDEKNILEMIYSKYSEIGKNIKCNLESKDLVLKRIQDCYDKATNILYEFNRIDRGFYYYELDLIDNVKSKIENVRNKLGRVKVSVKQTYENISEFEKQIRLKVDELDKLKINSFDYNMVEEV